MAFIAGLMTQDPTQPSPWKMYALATLIRCASVGDITALTDWMSWAGATRFVVIPPDVAFGASRVVCVGDRQDAIVAYAGTQDGGQLIGQIAGSVQATEVLAGARYNSGQYMIYRRTATRVSSFLTNNLGTGGRTFAIGTSLGGACANFLARIVRQTGEPAQIFTTGCPRVGNGTFISQLPSNHIRLINGNDLVTTVPPESDTLNIIVGLGSNGTIQYNYEHGGTSVGMVQGQDGSVTLQSPFAASTLSGVGQTVLGFATSFSFSNSLTAFHAIESYIANLSLLIESPPADAPNMTPLRDINNRLSGRPPQPPRPPTRSDVAPEVVNRMQDPAVVINDGDPPVTIPPDHVGRRAENRRMAVTPNPPQSSTVILSLPRTEPVVMPNYVKCTFMFRQLGQAWSETYYLGVDTIANAISAASNVNPGNTKINTLATAMMALRGPQCSLTAVRLSQVTVPKPVTPTRVSILSRFTPARVGTWATAPTEADLYNTCIVLQMLTGDGAPPKLTHMRGIPDSFVTLGGQPVSDLATFFGAAWTSPTTGLPAVLSGDQWLWIGRGTIRQGVITDLVQDASGTVTITTTTATLLAGLTAGQVLPFRISGVTQPRAINGQWPFTVNGGLLSITTKKLFGILNWDQGVQGRITFDPRVGHAITVVRYNNIGSRLAGRPSDLQRGRQPNRSRN